MGNVDRIRKAALKGGLFCAPGICDYVGLVVRMPEDDVRKKKLRAEKDQLVAA